MILDKCGARERRGLVIGERIGGGPATPGYQLEGFRWSRTSIPVYYNWEGGTCAFAGSNFTGPPTSIPPATLTDHEVAEGGLAGQTATDTFAYTVKDAAGATSSTTSWRPCVRSPGYTCSTSRQTPHTTDLC